MFPEFVNVFIRIKCQPKKNCKVSYFMNKNVTNNYVFDNGLFRLRIVLWFYSGWRSCEDYKCIITKRYDKLHSSDLLYNILFMVLLPVIVLITDKSVFNDFFYFIHYDIGIGMSHDQCF